MVKDVAHRRAIPSLDGLRGVAVLLVVAAHLGLMDLGAAALRHHRLGLFAELLAFDAGDLGVSVFFVISGYLITMLLIREQENKGEVSLRDFYVRRFFRIFPPYYFYLLLLGLLWILHIVPMLRGAFVSSALYVSNYYPYRLSQPSTQGWLVGHTWSLSLEEQFYLLWPASLCWLGRKRAAWLGCGLLVLSPISRIFTLHLIPSSTLLGQVDRMFHTRVDTIMAGCVLALVGVWPKVQAALLGAVQRKDSAFFALILLFAVVHTNNKNFIMTQLFGLSVEALLLAYLIFFAIANASSRGGRLLNHSALRHIGVISYSLYLWQQLWTGQIHLRGINHLWMRLVLIPVCAELSYLCIEKPSVYVRDWYLARREKRS